MDQWITKQKIGEWVKKYKFVILIVLIGIVCMLLPTRSQSQSSTSDSATVVAPKPQTDLAEDLEKILSQIHGVGKVRVLLTVSTGERIVYQEDSQISSNETNSTVQKETVIITDSERTQQALVSHVVGPTYLGALIVCQGADRASVKLAVLDAVSKITGLSADMISVVKMK